MEVSRTILNFGSRQFTDNAPCIEETHERNTTLDDFLLDDLAEFSDEEIAAPIDTVDIPEVPSFQSCASLSSLRNNSFFQGSSSATKPLDELNRSNLRNGVGSISNVPAPETDWLSTFDKETYAFYDDFKFEDSSFSAVIDEKTFFSASELRENPLLKVSQSMYPNNSFGSSACEEQSESSAEAKGSQTPFTVRGRGKRARRSSAVRAWSSGILWNRVGSKPGSTSDLSDPSFVASLDFCSGNFSQCRSAEDEALIYVSDPSSAMKNILCSSDTNHKLKRKSKFKKGHDTSQALPRRCVHCLSLKTPQWRAGPTGPKTLCNACGVRYKSGRLFPEYRPAKSPTFLDYVHSNSHRKVLEMRRQKPVQESPHLKQEEDQFLKRKLTFLHDPIDSILITQS